MIFSKASCDNKPRVSGTGRTNDECPMIMMLERYNARSQLAAKPLNVCLHRWLTWGDQGLGIGTAAPCTLQETKEDKPIVELLMRHLGTCSCWGAKYNDSATKEESPFILFLGYALAPSSDLPGVHNVNSHLLGAVNKGSLAIHFDP